MKEYYVEPEIKTVTETGIEFFYQNIDSTDIIVHPHIHTAVEILFIDKGHFRVFADNQEYILSPGDTILFRSHTIHKVFALSKGKSGYYVLKIKPGNVLDFASRNLGSSYLLRLSLSNKNEKTVWQKNECDSIGLTELLECLISESAKQSYGSDIAMKLCSAKVLLLMLRDIEKEHSISKLSDSLDENLVRRIYNSIVYINSNYAEELTAEECGKLQYMSYSYFSRSFKRITGMCFKDYLNMTRINHAEKALLSSNKTITQISAECGFNNVSYFISTYKRFKGVTPAAFRDSVIK